MTIKEIVSTAINSACNCSAVVPPPIWHEKKQDSSYSLIPIFPQGRERVKEALLENGISLPGSFGRMELLRPYRLLSSSTKTTSSSSSCLDCSRLVHHEKKVVALHKERRTKRCTVLLPTFHHPHEEDTANTNNAVGNDWNVSSGTSPLLLSPSLQLRQRHNTSSNRIRCPTCIAIQSLAKFIPRKNFLNFFTTICHEDSANTDDNNSGMRKRKRIEDNTTNNNIRVSLKISGGDASRLVRIHSATAIKMASSPASFVDNKSTLQSVSSSSMEEKVVNLQEGDIISILWYRLKNNNYHEDTMNAADERENNGVGWKSPVNELEPLIQYRLVRRKQEDNAYDKTISKRILNCDHDEETVTKKVGGSISSVLKDDGIAKIMSDAGNHDEADNTISLHRYGRLNDTMIDQGKQSAFNETNDFCEGSRRNNEGDINDIIDNDEGCSDNDIEDESAPLSLPSRFLSSHSNYSFSFDSMEKLSPSQLPSPGTAKVDVNNIVLDRDISFIKNDTSKEPTILEGMSNNTPKKTNVASSRDALPHHVPITSISYDEMLKIHDEMTHPIFSVQSSSPVRSVRHTIVSYMLHTCKSNSFSRECTKGKHKKMNTATTKTSITTTSTAKQENLSKDWIPRLLLGTRINLKQYNE